MFRRLVAAACLLSYGLLSVAGSGLHLLSGHGGHDHLHAVSGSDGCGHGHSHHHDHGHAGHHHGHGRCDSATAQQRQEQQPPAAPLDGWRATDDLVAQPCAVCTFLTSLRTAAPAATAEEGQSQLSAELVLGALCWTLRSPVSAYARGPPA